jgi:hypothetical protein
LPINTLLLKPKKQSLAAPSLCDITLLAQIMKITGHKKLSTLQKYIKSDSDIEMMLDIGNSIGRTIK